MKRLLHMVSHLLGWNTGRVETWWESSHGRDRLMTGFRCSCGELTLVDEAFVTRPRDP